MEMVKGGEIVHDDVTIPQITVNQEKFNTVNLQQEIAKGMQQIIDAKGKNEVADTMDTIKKIVEDIPYLKLEKEQEDAYVKQPEEAEHIATDEEIDGSLRLNFKELLGEDADGQMSMVMSEKLSLSIRLQDRCLYRMCLKSGKRPDMRLKLHLGRLSSRSLSQLRQGHSRRQETSWRD